MCLFAHGNEVEFGLHSKYVQLELLHILVRSRPLDLDEGRAWKAHKNNTKVKRDDESTSNYCYILAACSKSINQYFKALVHLQHHHLLFQSINK
jgi:hypothetical protein